MTRVLKGCVIVMAVIAGVGCRGPSESDASGGRAGSALEAAEIGAAAATDQPTDRVWTFDDDAPGVVPAGWRVEQTNPRGDGAVWAVVEDGGAGSGRHALALVDPRGARGSTYNLAWTEDATFRDGRVEVRVRAGSGREDQGGGPIWRVRDRENYYVARWNPLEDNFRVYFVRDASRRELASADVRAAPTEWHRIAIEHRGDLITGYFDGQRMWEVRDDTFLEAGGVGVWTKADAASRFDDLSIGDGTP